MKRYAYAGITLAFFAVSMVLHWWFGWLAFVDEARQHHQAPEVAAYLIEEIDRTHFRRGGHAPIHQDPPYGPGAG